jgi:hypothetical protein
MAALLHGSMAFAAYVLAAWASWHIVGIALWNGSDVSQIATPTAMIAAAYLIGRGLELSVGAALSRRRR